MAVLNRAKSSFPISKHKTYIDYHDHEAPLPPEILLSWPSDVPANKTWSSRLYALGLSWL